MDNKTVVVILLLITIILSIVSVVLTLSVNLPDYKKPEIKLVNSEGSVDSNSGQVSLIVTKPGAT